MNLNQLEYFVAVAETLNFTQAAKRCFISQTAISLQIKALEDKVGVPLFIRDKHHVALTTAGQVYLTEARAILERSTEAIKLAQTAAEGVSGSISIGFIRGYEQSYFSDTLRMFHTSNPNISIDLIRDNMSMLFSRLENNECDITFNLAPYVTTMPQFEHRYLKSYQIMAVLYPAHPLASRDTLTYKDLQNEEFIIMQPKGSTNEEVEEIVLCKERGGFMPNIIIREQEVQTLLFMVSAAMGISILPEYTVRYFNTTKNLRIIPLVTEEGLPETLDFEMSWSPDNKNPVLQRFLDWTKIMNIKE